MPFRSESEASRGRRLGRWAIALGLLWIALGSPPAQAAERSVADVVLVEQGAVIDDDLYAAGNRVVIEGRVDGDLVVAAYEDVTITGEVTGDVTGLAGSVRIPGRVGESVRVASPQVDVTGVVGGDIVVLAWAATLASDVAGGATVWAWAAESTGVIEGDLEGQMRRLTLGGRVGGNVDVTVGRLEMVEGAEVGRDLGYRSEQVAVGMERAEVGGTVVHRLPLPPNIRVRALMILAKVALGLMAAVTGLLVMWAIPRASEEAWAGVESSWWRAWLQGLAVMALPLAVVIVTVVLVRIAPLEAALPLSAVFFPLVLAAVGAVMALVFLAPAAAFPWLGRLGNQKRGPVRAFLYGAAAVIVLSLVPWVTWVIVLFVLPLGIGGWLSPLLVRQSQPTG